MASNRPGTIKPEQGSASRTFSGMRQIQEGDIDELRPRRGRVNEPRAPSMQQVIDAFANQPQVPLSGFMQGLLGQGGGALLFNQGPPPPMQIPAPLDIPYRGRRREGAVERLRGDVARGEEDYEDDWEPEDPSGGIGEIGDVATIPDGRRPDPPTKTSSIKDDIVSGIREALGIGIPAPYYVPNKINRDNGRLGAINRIPQSKTWSIAELEYYNKKGYVNYNIKNVQNRRLPNVFAPTLPTLELERRAPSTSYNKPAMYGTVERMHQAHRDPISYLVA